MRTLSSEQLVVRTPFCGLNVAALCRAFRKFSGFSSGIGIQYAESAIIDASHQPHARNLIIGKRIPPQILIRAADHRPFELQDLLPSDGRFKVIIFTGDTSQAPQRARLATLAMEMGSGNGFLKQYSSNDNMFSAFDIITISSTKKIVRHTDVPELFRSHWSKSVSRLLLLDID